MTKVKAKVEVEKPVFCVVEQTTRPSMDRYRVVIFKNISNKTLKMEGTEYKLVEEHAPSINAHAFRQWCAEKNAEHHRAQKALQAQRQEEQERKMQADRAAREEKRKADRRARWQERRDGARHAGPILREMAIRARKMEEVETGERCL